MTMRGCGDLTLSTPRAYDASKTEDLDLAVVRVHERYPQAPLFLVGCVCGCLGGGGMAGWSRRHQHARVGRALTHVHTHAPPNSFSLGANIMVKWLGEKGEGARGLVAAAVSVSNPWCFLPHIESLHYTSQRRPKPGLLRRLSARVYSMLIAHEYKRVRGKAGPKGSVNNLQPPRFSTQIPTIPHTLTHVQYVRRNMAVLEEPLKKAVTRPLEQMFTLRELDEHVRTCVHASLGAFLVVIRNGRINLRSHGADSDNEMNGRSRCPSAGSPPWSTT